MKKILYTSPHIPVEWIEACGIQPVRIMPHGGTEGNVLPSIEGSCGYMRGFFNDAANIDSDGLIASAVCDQMRRGFDLASESLNRPLFLFNVPVVANSVSSLKLYKLELNRLQKFCESMGGTFDHDRLIERIDHHAKCRSTLESLIGAVPYADFRTVQRFYFENNELPENIIDRSLSLSKAGNTNASTGSATSTKVNIAIVGGPLTGSGIELASLLESHGCRIVIDGTESGTRAVPAPIDRRLLTEDPLEAVAESWLYGIKSIYQRPNAGIFSWLEKAIKSNDIQGIMLVRWVWCDLWHGETRRIAEWSNKHSVEIDLHGSDSFERNRTRVEAFAESLTDSTMQ